MSEPAIKYAWVYGNLYAESFDTLRDAIRDSIHAEDWGNESLHVIECGDMRVTRESDAYREVRTEIEADERARRGAIPKATHSLHIKSPVKGGKWALVDSGSHDYIMELQEHWAELVDKRRIAVRAVGK